ncbi:hypothetical protein HZH66_013918 [Vespula vulgaris]|uniref:Uncharacterized protein n=1 Tax=Vespula vulgaris TaxID=7454 RepID=A0A834J6U8_VESVU|nr:hypothetical protein HZH66_013918 [Vespula vulgaris]
MSCFRIDEVGGWVGLLGCLGIGLDWEDWEDWEEWVEWVETWGEEGSLGWVGLGCVWGLGKKDVYDLSSRRIDSIQRGMT